MRIAAAARPERKPQRPPLNTPPPALFGPPQAVQRADAVFKVAWRAGQAPQQPEPQGSACSRHPNAKRLSRPLMHEANTHGCVCSAARPAPTHRGEGVSGCKWAGPRGACSRQWECQTQWESWESGAGPFGAAYQRGHDEPQHAQRRGPVRGGTDSFGHPVLNAATAPLAGTAHTMTSFCRRGNGCKQQAGARTISSCTGRHQPSFRLDQRMALPAGPITSH